MCIYVVMVTHKGHPMYLCPRPSPLSNQVRVCGSVVIVLGGHEGAVLGVIVILVASGGKGLPGTGVAQDLVIELLGGRELRWG